MARLYEDFIDGTLSATSAAGATTSEAGVFIGLPAVSGGDEVVLVFDPTGAGNGPEIVRVTAHTGGSDTVTHDALAAEHALGTRVVQSVVAADMRGLSPTGTVTAFAGTTAPTGWLLCDGAAVSRTTYATLFAIIGTTYGAGDGSTTFNVPNLRGRVVAGRDAAQTEFDVLGETGGAKTHTLSSTEMPGHTHTASGTAASAGSHTHSLSGSTGSAGSHSHSGSYVAAGAVNNVSGTAALKIGGSTTIPSAGAHTHSLSGTASSAGAHTHTVTVTVNSAGSGGAHNNLQPYLVLNHIIKV